MSELYRVIDWWVIDKFPGGKPTPERLATLNELVPSGMRYVPQYANGNGQSRIELQEYVTDRESDGGGSAVVPRESKSK